MQLIKKNMPKRITTDQILLEEVLKDYAKSNSLNEKDCFDNFCLNTVVKNFTISNEQIEDSIIDGGGDGGIDSIMCFFNEEYLESKNDLEELVKINKKFKIEVKLIQIKNSNSLEEEALNKIKSSLEDIFSFKELSIYNPEFQEKANLVREVWKKAKSKYQEFSLNVIYTCKGSFINLSNSFKDKKLKIEKFLTDQQIKSSINFYWCKRT
jgi:hypothetical protein